MVAKLTRLTHEIVIQLHLVAEFSLQAASPETFGYTLIAAVCSDSNFKETKLFCWVEISGTCCCALC